MGWQFAQDRAHGTAVAADEAQRQRDEFVVARGDIIEHDAFEDRHAVLTHALVAVERLAVGRIDARGVDADQLHARVGQSLDGGRGEGREGHGVRGHQRGRVPREAGDQVDDRRHAGQRVRAGRVQEGHATRRARANDRDAARRCFQ